MGLLTSRFRRKKTTGETLEQLDKALRTAEEHRQATEERRRRTVANLMVASVGLYVFAAALLYLYCRPAGWRDGLIYFSPLLVSPVLIVMLRSVVARYYDWKLRRNRVRLQSMRDEKKRILEEVMDKETYKVAKELLDKYASPEPDKTLQLIRQSLTPSRSLVPALNNATPNQLRQRPIGQSLTVATPQRLAVAVQASPNQLTPLKGDHLPRPILSGSGGGFERLVDYLIGDGPGSRYALICSNCKGHNGMALPEEFEYVAYRCAYCRHPNAARKTRPRPPQLVTTPVHTDTSDHKTSSEDSDDSLDARNISKSVKHVSIVESPSPVEGKRDDHSVETADADKTDGDKTASGLDPVEDMSIDQSVEESHRQSESNKKED